jgi:hypothetical protein
MFIGIGLGELINIIIVILLIFVLGNVLLWMRKAKVKRGRKEH